jgi:hypothetical protein
MAAWARVSVLIIDDLLLRPLTGDQAADLLEVIEDRARLRATIVTSQLRVSHWHEAVRNPTIADAALDRLLENAPALPWPGSPCTAQPTAPAPGQATPAASAPAPAQSPQEGSPSQNSPPETRAKQGRARSGSPMAD